MKVIVPYTFTVTAYIAMEIDAEDESHAIEIAREECESIEIEPTSYIDGTIGIEINDHSSLDIVELEDISPDGYAEFDIEYAYVEK